MGTRTQLETHQLVAEQAREWNPYLGSRVRPNQTNPDFTSVFSVLGPAVYCNAWMADDVWKVHAIAHPARQESFSQIENGRGLVGLNRARKLSIEALASTLVLESVVFANRTIEAAEAGAAIPADEVDYAAASIRMSAPVLARLARENGFRADLQQEILQGALLAGRHV